MQINMDFKKVERKWSCHVWLLISCRVCFGRAHWTLVSSLAAEEWCLWLCLALGEAQKAFLRPACFSFCFPHSQSVALLCLPRENCCCCRLCGFVLRTQAESLGRRENHSCNLSLPCLWSGSRLFFWFGSSGWHLSSGKISLQPSVGCWTVPVSAPMFLPATLN